MSNPNSAFLVFDIRSATEGAIRSLGQSGFDMKNLSLVGKGYHSGGNPMGFYTVGDRIRAWAGSGAFWGGIWGLAFVPAVFVLPGLGVVGISWTLGGHAPQRTGRCCRRRRLVCTWRSFDAIRYAERPGHQVRGGPESRQAFAGRARRR